jgi:hypothetical protein
MSILEEFKIKSKIKIENFQKTSRETQNKNQKNNRSDKRDTLKDLMTSALYTNDDFLKLLDEKWFQKTGIVSYLNWLTLKIIFNIFSIGCLYS